MARISAKSLVNFQSVNSFQYANQWIIRAGELNTLYFQLFDLDQGAFNTIGALNFGAPISSFSGNAGQRYVAGIGGGNQPVVLTVTFPSIDNVKILTLTAVQNIGDGSVFSVTIPANKTPSGGNVIFNITEGSVARKFSVLNMLAVEYPGNDGSDGSLPNIVT